MAEREAACGGSIQENISPFFEWTYAQIGDARGESGRYGYIAFGDPRENGYGLLTFEEDVLIGANLINCTRFAGLLRRAIIWKTHCGSRREWINYLLTEHAVMPYVSCDEKQGLQAKSVRLRSWQRPRIPVFEQQD
jgi:hypothetical protein